jgi:hypothetical protein
MIHPTSPNVNHLFDHFFLGGYSINWSVCQPHPGAQEDSYSAEACDVPVTTAPALIGQLDELVGAPAGLIELELTRMPAKLYQCVLDATLSELVMHNGGQYTLHRSISW